MTKNNAGHIRGKSLTATTGNCEQTVVEENSFPLPVHPSLLKVIPGQVNEDFAAFEGVKGSGRVEETPHPRQADSPTNVRFQRFLFPETCH
eukprot:5834923-Amphidinium_carterae.1